MSSALHQFTATNQWALIVGCAGIAYGPLLSIFALIVYPKPQLVILVTTFAMAFVLSATCSSMVYTILNAIFQFNHNASNSSSNSSSNDADDYDSIDSSFSSNGILFAAMIPSILFQFIFRCLFTSLYHTVERVISVSLQRQQQEDEHTNSGGHTNNNMNNNNNNNGTVDGVNATNQTSSTTTTSSSLPPTTTTTNTHATAADASQFKLALNDGSAAIAAGIGFGGMQALTLYGTLLSQQAVQNTTGILYQQSCPYIPSLVVSAILTNFFSILQLFWMALTFFGMRRRLLYSRGQCAADNDADESPQDDDDTIRRSRSRNNRRSSTSGRWFGNSRTGGNTALIWVLVTHCAASFLTLLHRRQQQQNGCLIVIPTLFGIVLCTAYIFYIGCGNIYMPVVVVTTSTNMNANGNSSSSSYVNPTSTSQQQSHSD